MRTVDYCFIQRKLSWIHGTELLEPNQRCIVAVIARLHRIVYRISMSDEIRQLD